MPKPLETTMPGAVQVFVTREALIDVAVPAPSLGGVFVASFTPGVARKLVADLEWAIARAERIIEGN